ncbi:MAG TPA: hypothetical protein DCM28_23185 [Phycisphaerales bacterium]|nr:hypothetical protein [Phycisphaerales bacterium]HCD32732.1 hypothetical protein [Phycisphaerales bacterium]|tara:strand:+ start:2190 stop:3296 length:1107 start_codon:yes stop_codon:yes gene_type:complete
MSVPSDKLCQSIKSQLIERFKDYELDTRLPSVRVLAAEFNVAYLTMNGVLNQLELEGYIRRIPRKGAYLASRERTVSTDMQTGMLSQPSTLVFAYPNFFSYATWSRLHFAEEQAVKRGLALAEFKLNPDTDYSSLCQMVAQRGDVCGVIIIPVPGLLSKALIKSLDQMGIPVVLLEPTPDVEQTQHLTSITLDWQKAGRMLAGELIQAGHQSLAYFRHEPNTYSRRMMLQGIKQASLEADVKLRVLGGSMKPWEDSRQSAFELTCSVLKQGQYTAGIYESMRGIQGAIRAAHVMEVTLPTAMSFVSIGRGNGDEAYFAPPTTTVDPNAQEELRLAFEQVLDFDNKSQRILVTDPQLVQRESVIDLIKS